MKRCLKGLYMAFGMFCAIPLPFHVWDEKVADLVMPCFPVVGGFIGVLWWGASELLLPVNGIHILLASAVAALLPFAASGFLHLDGYIDTNDAVLSRRPIEEKLRILKDPHAGSFAVIMLAVLFILQFASAYIVIEKKNYLKLLIIIPVISRCCSAMSILCLKIMDKSGLAKAFRQNTGTRHKVFVIFIAVMSAVSSFLIAGIFGVIVIAVTMAGFIAAMSFAYRDLKGVSGDTAGFALVISELCGLITMAVL